MQTIALEKSTIRDFLLVLLATIAISLLGRVSLPLWFTPIPLVVQDTAALLIGALLGMRRGASAVFAFIAQGAMGLPVFAGGIGGYHILLSPRGGYLMGYLLGAFLVGYLVENRKNLPLSLIAGQLTILACGMAYFSTFVGIKAAFVQGVLPFVLGSSLKVAACYGILLSKSRLQKLFSW